MSRDPIGYGAGTRLAEFAMDNPTVHLDPSGLAPDGYDWSSIDKWVYGIGSDFIARPIITRKEYGTTKCKAIGSELTWEESTNKIHPRDISYEWDANKFNLRKLSYGACKRTFYELQADKYRQHGIIISAKCTKCWSWKRFAKVPCCIYEVRLGRRDIHFSKVRVRTQWVYWMPKKTCDDLADKLKKQKKKPD